MIYVHFTGYMYIYIYMFKYCETNLVGISTVVGINMEDLEAEPCTDLSSQPVHVMPVR